MPKSLETNTPANSDQQEHPAPHPESEHAADKLRSAIADRDALASKLETLQANKLNQHLADSNINLRTESIRKLGHDTQDLVDDDLSINTEKLNEVLESIKADGFIITGQVTTLDSIAETHGIKEPGHLKFLATIQDSTYQNLFAEQLAIEARRRVNARVGKGVDEKWSDSLSSGEELYQQRKRDGKNS